VGRAIRGIGFKDVSARPLLPVGAGCFTPSSAPQGALAQSVVTICRRWAITLRDGALEPSEGKQ